MAPVAALVVIQKFREIPHFAVEICIDLNFLPLISIDQFTRDPSHSLTQTMKQRHEQGSGYQAQQQIVPTMKLLAHSEKGGNNTPPNAIHAIRRVRIKLKLCPTI